MTNKEALISMLPVSLPDNLIEKTFDEKGLASANTYSSAIEKDLDMVYLELLRFTLSQPQLSEGGLSLTIDKVWIKKEIKRIEKKYNIYTGNIHSSQKW